MARPLRYALVAATACALVAPGAAGASGRYVALGDSITVGREASDPDTTAYVPVFFEFLKTAEGGTLDELSNRAVVGETSGSLHTGSQLSNAVADIEDADSDTKVVSILIGANDRFSGCGSGYHQPSCAFEANFGAALDQLQDALAADPGDEDLMAATYYNPFTGAGPPNEPQGDALLLGSDGVVDCAGTGGQRGLNDLIACVGASKGAIVVDVYPTFKQGGQAYMAADQTHPNDTGYAAIADDFKEKRTRPPAPPAGDPPAGGPAPQPGPDPSPPSGDPPPPSNLFSIDRLRPASDGTATLVLDLPGPGTVNVLGTSRVAARVVASRRVSAIRRITRSVPAAGELVLRIRPSRRAKRILRRKGRLRVALRITYTPAGGASLARTQALTLRMKSADA